MKKTRTILIFLSAAIFFSSCSLIHFVTVKERKSETVQQYTHYLNSFISDTSFSYQLSCIYFDSLSTEKFAINTYKLKYHTSASPVQIRMYDKTGSLITGYEQCFGDISKLGMLETFPMKKIDHLPINYKLSLNCDIDLLNAQKEEKERILKSSEESDYTIIVFYSEWTGWYSKNTLKKLKKYIFKNQKSKILFIKVNTSPECINLRSSR